MAMQYQVIKTCNNPFGNYFKETNPKFHALIEKHYVMTTELVSTGVSVLITEFRKYPDKKCDDVMLYFCGYDDYFYHVHFFQFVKHEFDILVIDITGFGYNKRYSPAQPYQPSALFNYYDSATTIVKHLDVAFNYIARSYQYTNTYLYGHSTGGHICTTYLFYCQAMNRKTIQFKKVLLNSPLTRIYYPSQIILFLLLMISMIIGIFYKHFDLHGIVFGRNKKSDKTNYNRALNSIHKTTGLDYINYSYTGHVQQPICVGWINFVELATHDMTQSDVMIDYNTVLVCSEKYGTTGYFKTDAFLNPYDTIHDMSKIYTNLKYKQFPCPHDCLLAPYDNGTGCNWTRILDYLFEA